MAASLSCCLPGTPAVSELALDTFSLHNAALHYHADETTQLRFPQWSLYGRDDAHPPLRGLLTRSVVSELYKRRCILEQKLEALEDPEVVSPTKQSTITSDPAYATSYLDTKDLHHLSRRRKSIPENKIQEVDKDISSIAAAIASDAPLDSAQVRSMRKLISLEVRSISDELQGNSSLSQNHYPNNLTLRNFYSYIPLPTVVYELEYPREMRINWSYVAEKTAATFGVIGVMIVVSTAFIYPVVASAVQMKADGMPLKDRVKEMPWVFSDLLFPFFMEYILSWYVVWECVVSFPTHSLSYGYYYYYCYCFFGVC